MFWGTFVRELEDLMSIKKNRIISVLLALTLCIMCATSAFADSSTPVTEDTSKQVVSVAVDPSTARASGDVLTSCGGYVSGGSGTISCTLGSSNWNASIMAGVSSSSTSGTIECYVKLPSGSTKYLGAVPASGGNTAAVHFTYLSAGTYTFYFESSTSAKVNVYGFICD